VIAAKAAIIAANASVIAAIIAVIAAITGVIAAITEGIAARSAVIAAITAVTTAVIPVSAAIAGVFAAITLVFAVNGGVIAEKRLEMADFAPVVDAAVPGTHASLAPFDKITVPQQASASLPDIFLAKNQKFCYYLIAREKFFFINTSGTLYVYLKNNSKSTSQNPSIPDTYLITRTRIQKLSIENQ
jgi:hypothetical protein